MRIGILDDEKIETERLAFYINKFAKEKNLEICVECFNKPSG